MKLDETDKKIITELSNDGRINEKKLATELRISPQLLRYKIERLKGEVLNPAIIVNFEAFNLKSYVILLEKIDTLDIEKLSYGDNTFMFSRIYGGKFQWVLVVVTNDIRQLIKNNLSKYSLKVTSILNHIPDYFNFFNYTPKFEKHSINYSYKSKKLLTKLELKVLNILVDNPLSSYLNISIKSGIDNRTVKKKVEEMEKSNTILKFRYGVNTNKLGTIPYFLLIESPLQEDTRIFNTLYSSSFCGYVMQTINGYFVLCFPKNISDLSKLVDDILNIEPSASTELIPVPEFKTINTIPKIVKNNIEEYLKKSE